MTFPDNDEERMYDDSVAGNPTVNETQVRRAGRALDDERAADALREGDVQGAGSVQQGQTSAELAAQREDEGTADDGDEQSDGADTKRTASAQNARESKSQTGQTQSQRTGAQ